MLPENILTTLQNVEFLILNWTTTYKLLQNISFIFYKQKENDSKNETIMYHGVAGICNIFNGNMQCAE
jgi:hypothetical protein